MIIGTVLRNYKCYKGINFIPLSDVSQQRLNVIIGDNGVGKSAILESLNTFFNDRPWIIHSDCAKKEDCSIGAVFLINRGTFNAIADTKEQAIIEAISDAFWCMDISENATYSKYYEGLFRIRDNYIITRGTHYFIVIGKEYNSRAYSFLSFKSSVLGRLNSLHPTPSPTVLSSILSKVVGMYSYLYIPVETSVADFLKLEASGMQMLMDKNIKETISDELNKKIIKRTNGNRSKDISLLAIINEILEKYINEVQADIQEIDISYSFKPAQNTTVNLTANNITNVIIETYYSRRSLKKNGKPISSLSSGEKRLALIDIVSVFIAKSNSLERNLILAIDEPETSLHISKCYAQFRKVQEVALKHNHQLFITTHWYGSLPVINHGNLIHIGNQQIIEIFSLTNYFEERRSHPNDIHLKSYFDLAASIISAYRHENYSWILVEGKEDKMYLEYYIDTNALQIHIIPLGGCGNVKKVYEYLFAPMSSSNQEINIGGLSPKILCLTDTDSSMPEINVRSETKDKKLFIKRLNEKSDHEIELIRYESTTNIPTEIEDVLEPKLFFDTIKTAINLKGTDQQVSTFDAFEFDASVLNSRIKGDYSILNHKGNQRNIRIDKDVICQFIDENKDLIASIYTNLPKTGNIPNWIAQMQQLVSNS